MLFSNGDGILWTGSENERESFYFICEIIPEVKAAAKTEQLDDVEVALPVSCLYPMKTGTDEIIRTIRDRLGI